MPDKDEDFRVIDLYDAQLLTGRPVTWLRMLCRTGRLPYVRGSDSPNAKYFVRPADLKAVLTPKGRKR